ncbi:hypothetical protein [Streptomyces olivoreticuli]|uniref:hypothetical protein n=1 Tax=Streptomyces olivoreticuli TaxID=68246 RepID=UPI000E235E90|nr:hypothetical protein [Streptomyces olivoreticuli]
MNQGHAQEPFDPTPTLEVIGPALVGAVPAGWYQIRCEFRGTVQIDGAQLASVSEDGSSVRHRIPGAVMTEFDTLRSAMYRPGTGTWFTARYVIERSGEYTIEFDYDNEPAFVPQLTPGAYLLDSEYYPRDAEHTPEWLLGMLREARGMSPSVPRSTEQKL